MGKVGGSESRLFGNGQAGVESTEMIHQAQVGGNGGARGFSDGRLIHLNHAVDGLSAVDRFPAGIFLGAKWGGGGKKDFSSQGAFARAADAGKRGEAVERDRDIDAVNIASDCSLNFDP
jgi:hypothetical protein